MTIGRHSKGQAGGGRVRAGWPALAPVVLAGLLAAAPAGRIALGHFGRWGAFRDPAPPHCFAIAQPVSGDADGAFVALSTWPRRRVHGQMQIRLSRPSRGPATLDIAGRLFTIEIRDRDGWAIGSADAARITSALRGKGPLSIAAADLRGRRFHDRYPLDGAASAIDAMRLGCLAT